MSGVEGNSFVNRYGLTGQIIMLGKGILMKTIWKLQDAGSQFCKLVKDALTMGPQFVAGCGDETVVELSAYDYENSISQKPDFKEFILNCPKMDKSFQIDRVKITPGVLTYEISSRYMCNIRAG